ncbi:MAG: methyl-accepting chemotaxis sensory transducer, partial [Polaromonas sp.]|nr:methyl-accepting chemotaxis sensory transducer [Polaromonas sp.]
MSVLENIQKLFKTKPERPEGSTSNFGMTDELDARSLTAGGRVNAAEAQEGNFSTSSMAVAEDGMLMTTELLSLPVLGVRPLGEHQKILVVALGLAVATLAVVTFFALSKSDRVAQQVAATGQALMQSQRLAKSASQALVGSAQAFPDVRESSDVLSKTVAGMKSGDDTLRLSAVSGALQPEVEKVTPLV